MDETVEKLIRSLKLKLIMAEKELQASSGKWKLGALLKAGHSDAMNREVDRVRERLEAKIKKIKADIAKLSGETSAVVAPKPDPKPVAATTPGTKKVEPKSEVKPSRKAAPAATKTTSKKTPSGKK